MNLSSLVHAGRHQSEPQTSQYNPKPQRIMATPLVTNPYTAHQNPSYSYATAPQPPPSPPIDDASKCSLPSISSLLGLADGSSPPEQSQQGQLSLLCKTENYKANSLPAQQHKVEYRPGSGHQYGPSPPLSSRVALPPTPPMHSDSGLDGRQSPTTTSNSGYSVASVPGYYFAPSPSVSAINNMEPHSQRQHVPALSRRVSMPATSMGFNQSPYNSSQYNASPSQQSMVSYYPSPMQPTPPQSQISDLYYQRPLPQVCSPQYTPLSLLTI
jgi:hypothetical protein